MSDYVDSHYARTAHHQPARPGLRERIDTQGCTVGGGLAGLSTALARAEPGPDGGVVEASLVGRGAAGVNTRVLPASATLPARATPESLRTTSSTAAGAPVSTTGSLTVAAMGAAAATSLTFAAGVVAVSDGGAGWVGSSHTRR